MLATAAAAPLDSTDLAYEPKYDGIRAIAAIDPPSPPRGSGGASPTIVRFWSRLGNDKTAQFPEVAAALRQWGRRLKHPVVLDGEIVALDARGNPVGFQHLQGRIHLKHLPRSRVVETLTHRAGEAAIAFVAFDVLRDGSDDLRSLPLRERRPRLEALLGRVRDPRLRISAQVVGDGRALHARAKAKSWEGLIAKRLDSVYTSGRRSPDWRKLKLVRRQTCVIGGWTDPRGSRLFFGALLLSVYDERGQLQYIGHSGAGFTDAELERVWKRLHALQSKVSPFATTPRTNERPHWVQPTLVAEVKFTEWTSDDKLRHPTYIGLREDIKPQSVRREPDTVIPDSRAARHEGSAPHANRDRGAERTPLALTKPTIRKLLDQIDAIEDRGGDGTLMLPGGDRLAVSNLGKVFWPKLKLTKGDLFCHYIRVAPFILPALSDRPLVMKRYPNGVNAKPFYQHRAPDKHPAGVRVEHATTGSDTRAHLIGGSLTTLLYTVQLASISQDPWFSRIQTEDMADHVAIDLDPPEGLPFRRVLDVARWVHEELDALNAPSFAKTSGASGLHIYIPMPPDTPCAAGLLFCQIVATIVARKHPEAATIERALKARGRRVYVDYLQNVHGKTLASVYSARANDFAGVSTPITWEEIDEGLKPQDFTIRTIAERLEAEGDAWAPLRRSKGADLRAVMKYAKP